MSKGLVIFSGGQDSTCALFWAKKQYKEVHALFFDYGQRHIAELESARIIASKANVPLHEVDLKGVLLPTNALMDAQQSLKEELQGNNIPKTFVPMRNSLFFVVAFNRALGLGCSSIITGLCKEDANHHPDTTDLFRKQIEQSCNTSLGAESEPIKILAPFATTPKHVVLQTMGHDVDLMEALAYSTTSYSGLYPPTDINNSNLLRAQSFKDAGIPDPLIVRAVWEGVMELPIDAHYSIYRKEATLRETLERLYGKGF